jgi:hypothetical protein
MQMSETKRDKAECEHEWKAEGLTEDKTSPMLGLSV